MRFGLITIYAQGSGWRTQVNEDGEVYEEYHETQPRVWHQFLVPMELYELAYRAAEAASWGMGSYPDYDYYFTVEGTPDLELCTSLSEALSHMRTLPGYRKLRDLSLKDDPQAWKEALTAMERELEAFRYSSLPEKEPEEDQDLPF